MPETLQPEVPPALDVLRSAALVLFGIFLVSVVLRSLPLRLLEPLWQVSFVTSVIDMGGYAILGVVGFSRPICWRPAMKRCGSSSGGLLGYRASPRSAICCWCRS